MRLSCSWGVRWSRRRSIVIRVMRISAFLFRWSVGWKGADVWGLGVGSGGTCRERLYFASGYGLIQCVKGLMSYEDEVRFPPSPHPPTVTLLTTHPPRISSPQSPIPNEATTSPLSIVKNKRSSGPGWRDTSCLHFTRLASSAL